jgi:L,D-peptidoglycan transpeptidase YkuD (ErfK/YbiS/YcfS/YnhG family)
MDIVVSPAGMLRWANAEVRCALGRSGVGVAKREGDGMTPAGAFPLRLVMYRPDRLQAPETGLSVIAIDPSDGWCDDPRDTRYNQLIRLPCDARHERLWRDDGLYDLLAVIGYNDDPIEVGLGSAIFLHVALADYGPTEGCVALALHDLKALLRICRPGDRIVIGSGLAQ